MSEEVDLGAAEGAVGGAGIGNQIGAPGDTAGHAGGQPSEAVGETVPRAEYEKLQHEQKQYREKWGTYDKTFSRLPTEQRDAFLALADLYATDPDDAAKQLASAFGLTIPEAEAALEENEEKPLTRKDIASLLDERDQVQTQKQATAAEVDQIRTQAKALGFEPGTRAYRELLSFAHDEHDGDLDSAAKALYEELDGISKSAQKAMIAKKGEGIVPVTSGDAPSGEKKWEKGQDPFRWAERATKAAIAGRAG